MYFVIDTHSKIGFKHIILVFALLAYTFLGAWIFIQLEKEVEQKEIEMEYRIESRLHKQAYIHHKRLDEMIEQLRTEKKITVKLRGRINSTEEYTMQWCKEVSDFKEPVQKQSSWNMYDAIFYASSLYTTVGYGNTYCVTVWGRIVTMVYALIGIPLVITILNDFGNLLFRLTCFVWNKITRLRQKLCKGRTIGTRCCMPTEIKNLTDEHDYINMETVPLTLALFICALYICICAGIYCIWEKWTFFVSFYYFFISLTTIGLGDVIPLRKKYAVTSGVLVLIGLAVVSMCLNVIQARLDAIFKQLMKTIDNQYKQSLESHSKIQGWDVLRKKQPLLQRAMFRFMGDNRKKMLREKWESKAKLRNCGVQTEPFVEDVGVQTFTRGKSAVFTQTMARNCFPCKGATVDRVHLNFDHLHGDDAEHTHIHEHHHHH